MVLSENQCSDAGLECLIKGHESSREYLAALQHVETCPACQTRLEQTAAGAGLWQEAREVLADSDDCADMVQVGMPWDRSPIAWNESMLKTLLSPPSHPEMLGRIGRYDVERLIGSGGMGVVFKAYDTELNRPVAVKLLAPYLAENGSARKRFARESRAAAAVVDEHVVAIHNVESGDTPRQPPFLVMKYIAGGSLQQRLDRDGPLDVCEVLRIGMQTAKGLAAAHAQGLIHRDVKPSNILLDEGVDRALLTDFGLARAEDDACLTRSGFHPGTPHYMSPEQVRGEAIDGRSDLFSLGCVLYALCTGHPPFRAETSYAVLRRITDDIARPIRELNSNIPEWLDQFVLKLLSKSREDRFDSAAEVAGLLEDCLAHVQHPTTTPLPKIVAQFSRRRPSPQDCGKGRIPLRKLAFIGFAAFSLVVAGVLIVLEMNKGTLTIESNADDVPIRVMRGDKIVDSLTVSRSGTATRIAAGEYVIQLDGDFPMLQIDRETVSLKRGVAETVKIHRTETSENLRGVIFDDYDSISSASAQWDRATDGVPPKNFPSPANDMSRADEAREGEAEPDGSIATERPKFATPEILMQHFADCQLRGDSVGCIDCYSDEVINGLAASYLMTAMMLRGDIFPGEPEGKLLIRDPKQQQSIDELLTMLQAATIDNPPAIASAALSQAAASYYSDNDPVKRDALTNDQVTLIATSPTMLKNPRQFVKDFAMWSEANEDEQSKTPPKKRRYRIEYEGDSVWSVNIEDNTRMGLKRFGDTWLLHEPWGNAAEAGESPDESGNVAGDDSSIQPSPIIDAKVDWELPIDLAPSAILMQVNDLSDRIESMEPTFSHQTKE
ncbi:serine/threonine-protein kinase [Rosistilla oblonga]|uniref:serine/threonine-protein kinase n=1 Tax=Rosistilla oblonga TaxID=2527990 RepID=UPI003A97A9A2